MPTPRTKANRKFNEKAYDRLAVTIPKGRKQAVQAYAEQQGQSINGLVNELLRADMGLSGAEWKKEGQ